MRSALTCRLCAIFLVLFVSGSAAAQDPSDGEGSRSEVIIEYHGELEDAGGRPISGIFPLRFKIYSDANSDDALWTEKQYVTVVGGDYHVPLGRKADLARSTTSGLRWIGVELVGDGEILRDKFDVEESQITTSGGGGAPDDSHESSETKELIKKAQNTDKMAFADVAERAVSADHADHATTADKVGSLSADKIEKLSNLALERLGEHIADPKAHDASGGKLGERTRVMDSVGGGGGRPYEETCPPGFVVTGIKGGSGRVVDSLSIICTELK